MSAGPFEFVFQENRAFVFGDASHCSDCSRVLDVSSIETEFELSQPSFDISVTMDGCVVVTDDFVAACVDIPGARFAAIRDGLARLEVDRVVRIEPFDSHVRAGPDCPQCGEPRYLSRSGPLQLIDGETLPEGFSHTDLAFGDTADFGHDQPILIRPVILVDDESARILKASELSGIHFIAHP